MNRPVGAAGALIRSCHPVPTAAVTAFAAVLAVSAGIGAGRTVLVAAAVLAGQLSIGWSNDRIDRDRDRSVGRGDKPVARQELPLAVVDTAVWVSVAATAGLSFALGWRAALVHLGAVACGWAYNLGVKATWWSWLPYALAFGALPAVATLAAAHPYRPGAWLLGAGALLGVVANLTNALPDLAADARTGVRGLPHRLGARAALLLATLLLIAVSALVVSGPATSVTTAGWTVLAAETLVALAGLAVAWPRPTGHLAFYGVIVVVAANVAVLAVGGHGLR